MHTLPALPYGYNALEPHIDAMTVELHYSKHHQTYCDKLNAGLAGTEFESLSLHDLVAQTRTLPESVQTIVKNHGGGLLNHNIYRETMTPGGSTPSANLQDSIAKHFGSWEEFKTQFTTKAVAVFGSGWTRLEKEGDNLIISNYPNQENPLMNGRQPILGVDVREHAYYLKCQNSRPEYLENRWSLINRDKVEQNIGA